MYRYIYAFIFGFGIHASSAQNASVTGTITDTASVAVGYATVAVFDLRDSSVLNFGLTDEDGGFELHRLPAQVPLRLLVSHVLFHSQTLNFRLDSNHQFLDIDTVRMNLKHNELAEATVTWEAPPILVRNDTIEFNADAFIGRPGSVVEDLLKRIPGLEIAEDGTMTVNGRKVSKITLDSKDFFGEDPEIMLKNIPARAIETVQVTEEKDPHGRPVESGEVTINLTLKPWAKKSHFGKAYGGYGSDNRYEGGVIWNFLRDTLQISVLGYSNNLSQTGFSYSDLYKLGGFNRSGVGSAIYYGDGRVVMDGVQFGGGNGITTSHGGGFNLNYDIPTKLKLSASYFYGSVQTDYLSNRSSETFFSDSTLYSYTGISQYLTGQSHVARANLEWFPDTVQQINLVPIISYRMGAADKNNTTLNGYSLDPGKQSQINNLYQNNYGQFEFRNELNWYRDFAKWNHSILTQQSYLKNQGDGNNIIFQSRFDPDSLVKLEDFQRQELGQIQNGFGLKQSYMLARPRSDTNQISFQTTYEIADQNKTVEVYEIDSTGEQGLFLPSLSTHFRERRGQIAQQISLGRKLNNGGTLRLSGSLQVWNLYLNNAINANELDRNFTFLNSSFLFNRSSSEKDLYFSLSTGMNLPESSDLLDLRDNSDPNRIQMGNPFLLAYRSNRLFLWTRRSNTGKKRGWSLYSNISHVTNAVVRESYYDETGRIITRPVNLEKGKNQLFGNISGSFYQTFKTAGDWSHRPRVRWYSSVSSGWTPVNEVLYKSESFSLGPYFNYTLTKKEYLDLSIGYDVSASYSRLVKLNDWRMSMEHEIRADIWWAPVEKFWIEAKCQYTYQTFSAGNLHPRQFTLLNMSVTRLVLKENRGQIRLSVFDVLGQNQAIFRTATQNQLVLTESNAVTRYVMLSFVYNFNSFDQKGRQRRGFEFW